MKVEKLFSLKNLLISFFLLAVGISLSLIFNPYENFSSLTYENIPLEQSNSKTLIKGVTVNGKFKAKENNLGIILLKFTKVPTVDYDHQEKLIFRIKELGQTKWHSENEYHSGIFVDNQTFPFGFSPITNSKGKTYLFQLKSLNGNYLNAVTIGHLYSERYLLNKSALLHNPKNLISFIGKKIYFSIFDIDFLLSSFLYITPLLLYWLWLLFKSNIKIYHHILNSNSRINNFINFFVVKNRGFYIFIFSIIVVYTLLLHSLNIGISLFIICAWILSISARKVSSTTSFIFFTLFLILGFIGIILSQINFSTRISSWAFIFLLIGSIQTVYEIK